MANPQPYLAANPVDPRILPPIETLTEPRYIVRASTFVTVNGQAGIFFYGNGPFTSYEGAEYAAFCLLEKPAIHGVEIIEA